MNSFNGHRDMCIGYTRNRNKREYKTSGRGEKRKIENKKLETAKYRICDLYFDVSRADYGSNPGISREPSLFKKIYSIKSGDNIPWWLKKQCS